MARKVKHKVEVQVGEEGTQFRQGMRKNSKALAVFGGALKKARSGTIGLGLGIAALAGGAGLVLLGNEARDTVDRLAKLAGQFGTSVSTIQQFGLAARLSGLDTEAFSKFMIKMGDVVSKQLLAPTKVVTRAIKALGIDFGALSKLTPDKQFIKLSLALQKIKDPMRQTAIGSTLFGRSFQNLVPFINSADTTLARSKHLFEDLGVGISDSGAKSVEQLNDNIEELSTSISSLGLKVFTKFAPQINEAVEAMLDFAHSLLRAEEQSKLVSNFLDNGIGKSVTKILSTMKGFKEFAANFVAPFKALGKFLFGALKFLGTVGGALGASVGLALEGDFKGAGRAFAGADDFIADRTFLGGGEDELPEQTALLRRIERKVGSQVAVAG